MRLTCPNCNCDLDIVAAEQMVEVKCPSCGSQVDISSHTDTQTYIAPKLGRLGPFELLAHIGRGHFGDVYKAKDSRLERLVAVKVPRTEDLVPAAREAFFREARTNARLRHANIVTVHEVGSAGDTIFIASELIDGVNLADLIAGRKLEPRRAAEIAARVADALHHAHEQDVVHRDLKPRNIMLDEDDEPHLLDFGLAKQSASEFTITSEGDILGTPAYMAPEQARGQSGTADRRTDVYSLGVTLYEMLTGQRPFAGEIRGLIFQILHEDPPPPRKLAPEIPRDLETICLKAMAKQPATRYATAAEMAADLRRYLAGEPIQARRAGLAERAARWCRRNPALAAAGSLATAASLALGVLAYAYGASEPGPPKRNVEIDVRLAQGPFQHDDDPRANLAEAVFWPLDREGTPRTERPIRVSRREPPLEAALPAGHYLVVIVGDGDRFHEFYRYVPPLGEIQTFRYRHQRSDVRADGVVVLPSVSLPHESVSKDMAAFPGAEDFLVGDADLKESPPHHRKLPAFRLDPREVTADDLREAMKIDDLIKSQGNRPGDYAASDLSWDAAAAWAEYAGKRLPSEVEYEFAATAGGTQQFPWTVPSSSSNQWSRESVGGAEFDRTSTKPPVVGLYSNVAEWTDTWLQDYPPAKAKGITTFVEPRDWRVVRGAPAAVLMENVSGRHLGSGPRYRHMLTRDARQGSVGFRCARSNRPRLAAADFERVLDLGATE